MRKMRKMLSLVAVMCLVFVMSIPTYASSDASPEVAKSREGVLQVRVIYTDDRGNEVVLQTGSGFLVGTSAGATTVITNDHVIRLSDSYKEELSEVFGVDFFNSNEIDLHYEIVVKRDVTIDASYVNGSEVTDFAILELSQAIFDRAPLKLADSDDLVETQKIYALGFPALGEATQDDAIYTTEDVTITNGIISKFQTIDSVSFIAHDALLSSGNSGGPLVNSNGEVVGVNTATTNALAALLNLGETTTYYYSLSINEVAEVLDALGIQYEKAGESVAEEESVVEEPVIEEPVVEEPVIEEPVGEAAVIEEPVIEEPVVEKGPNVALIAGIAGGVILVAVVVIVIVTSNSKKSKKQSVPAGPVGNIPPQPPTPPVPPVPPTPPTPHFTMPVDSGAGETGVLGSGAGETSVLGGASTQAAATITRKKNGESVRITKPLYIIGKERQKVDFCISDNNSISRQHVQITCRGGAYFITDNNSTNFTYVNGNKIAPKQEVKLNSGDKIKLADEEFDFRI